MIRRLLPAPWLSLALIALWLVLNRSLGVGQFLLAVLFGVAAPALLAPLRPTRVRIRRPGVLLALIGAVAIDVLRSNAEVAWTLLWQRVRPVRSAFVEIPIELRDANALASLAIITTVVPGTVWCELARDSSALLLHVWHVPDEAAFIAHYKARYERPLMEIFES